MNSKAIIAIVIAAVVVAAGVGIAVAVTNNGGNPSGADHVKGNVQAGDFIKIHCETSVETVKSTTLDGFLDELYYDDYVTEKIVNVTFNGTSYPCCVTEIPDNDGSTLVIYAVEKSGFILKEERVYAIGRDTKTLTETNLDVGVEKSKQKIGIGAEFEYYTSKTVGTERHTGLFESGYATYFDVTAAPDRTMKVASVSGDSVRLESGETMTMAQFRSYVSEKDWRAEYGTPGLGSTIIKNPEYKSQFGIRSVTDETLTVGTVFENRHYNIVYGTEGFLYYIAEETTAASGGLQHDITYVVDTSMRV